jgi:hypothetical protein
MNSDDEYFELRFEPHQGDAPDRLDYRILLPSSRPVTINCMPDNNTISFRYNDAEFARVEKSIPDFAEPYSVQFSGWEDFKILKDWLCLTPDPRYDPISPHPEIPYA